MSRYYRIVLLKHDDVLTYDELEKRFRGPSLEDVLLSDIDAHHLTLAARLYFKIEHLSTTTFPRSPFPARGCVYGDIKERLLIPLAVQACDPDDVALPVIVVLFVVDTGAPNTYVSLDALRALGVTRDKENFTLRIQVIYNH